MDNVTIVLPVLWKWVLGLCGMIVAVGGAAAVLNKLRKPYLDMVKEVAELKKKVNALEQRHAADQHTNEEKFKSDLKTMEDLNDCNRHMCGCMLALLDHMISGNSVDRMKEVRDEMRDWLIKK